MFVLTAGKQELGPTWPWSHPPLIFEHSVMRVVGEIPHPECKITIFHWNNRYLIKIEAGPFEQTFKVNDYDISSEADLNKILSQEFISQAIARFSDMSRSLAEATDQI
jgi:hypothetical protein